MVRWRLQEVFRRLDVPVVSYRILTTESERTLAEHFERLNLPEPLQPQTLARVVVETKVTQEKSPWHQRQWVEPFAFLTAFREKVEAEEVATLDGAEKVCHCEYVSYGQTVLGPQGEHHDAVGCGGRIRRRGILDDEDRIG